MRKFFFLLSMVVFLGIGLILPGCEVDYYDPSKDQGSGSSLFGDSITVPFGFDWATMRAVNVNVKVDDQYNGNYYYTVELFDANPLFDVDATLLSRGVAKKNNDFSVAVTLPQAVETVYVQQTNPTGKKTIAAVDIASSSLNYEFTTVGPTLRSASAGVNETGGSYALRAASDLYTLPTLPSGFPSNYPSSCKPITGGSFDINGGPYLVSGSGDASFWEGSGNNAREIYVAGTFTGSLGIPGSQSKGDSKLIVLQDGIVTAQTIGFWNGKGEIYVAGTLTANTLEIPDGSILFVSESGTVKVTTDFAGKGEIYVAGTLEITGKYEIPTDRKLIVLPGGTVTVKSGKDLDVKGVFYNNGTTNVSGSLKTNNSKAEIINDHILHAQSVEIATDGANMTNNGTLEVSGNLKISNNNGKIVNTNSITAQSLTFDNGNFENNGITTIQGHTAATNSTVNFVNDNSFTTNTMEVRGLASIRNNCHMVINGLLDLPYAQLFVGEGALLTTTTLIMKDSRVELGSAAMMHVKTLATFSYNSSGSGHGFYGTGTNKALLKMTRVVQGGSSVPIIHYQGNLEIECYDHPAENVDSWNKRWTQSGVTWAGEGGSSLVIPSTGCNDGGYNNVTPSPAPTSPSFPIIFDGISLTYLFEDNWPYLGDYDMNDLVLDVKPTYTMNSSNKVTRLELDVTLRAVGASRKLATGLQLEGINRGMISSISRSNDAGVDGSVFSQSNGLESGQAYAVIPLFDDVHGALGHSSPIMTNTIKGSKDNVSPTQVKFTIVFNNPLDQSNISVDKFNVFIVNAGYKGKRQEVHMPGFPPTDKGDRSKFGSADDNSNAQYYISKNNLIWGLAIPGPAKYPTEWTSIRFAYSGLESWATSGGASSKDWYKKANENRVYE